VVVFNPYVPLYGFSVEITALSPAPTVTPQLPKLLSSKSLHVFVTPGGAVDVVDVDVDVVLVDVVDVLVLVDVEVVVALLSISNLVKATRIVIGGCVVLVLVEVDVDVLVLVVEVLVLVEVVVDVVDQLLALVQ
jgi:hypothetical protein